MPQIDSDTVGLGLVLLVNHRMLFKLLMICGGLRLTTPLFGHSLPFLLVKHQNGNLNFGLMPEMLMGNRW